MIHMICPIFLFNDSDALQIKCNNTLRFNLGFPRIYVVRANFGVGTIPVSNHSKNLIFILLKFTVEN